MHWRKWYLKMTIKIYKPSKSSMQSGLGKTKQWLAEYISEKDKIKDTLMGWNSSLDTKEQIKMFFDKEYFTDEESLYLSKKKLDFKNIVDINAIIEIRKQDYQEQVNNLDFSYFDRFIKTPTTFKFQEKGRIGNYKG